MASVRCWAVALCAQTTVAAACSTVFAHWWLRASRIGKYSVKGTVYDPLGLADKYDINWMREAELKYASTFCILHSGHTALGCLTDA